LHWIGSLITSLEKRRAFQRTHHWTMVTVANWAAYQQSEDEGHHTEHHAGHHTELGETTHNPPHQSPHVATPSKEVKNLSKKYRSNSAELDTSPKPKSTKPGKTIDPAIREWFERDFWPMYPRHEGRMKALEAANEKATTSEVREFYLAGLKKQLPEYARRKQESGQSVIPLASIWFNQNRAEDEFAPPSQPRTGKGRNPVHAANDYPEYVPLVRSAG
jgi:hypothetical protein